MAQSQQCIEYHCKVNEMEKEVGKVSDKIDKILWWVIGTLTTSIVTLVSVVLTK